MPSPTTTKTLRANLKLLSPTISTTGTVPVLKTRYFLARLNCQNSAVEGELTKWFTSEIRKADLIEECIRLGLLSEDEGDGNEKDKWTMQKCLDGIFEERVARWREEQTHVDVDVDADVDVDVDVDIDVARVPPNKSPVQVDDLTGDIHMAPVVAVTADHQNASLASHDEVSARSVYWPNPPLFSLVVLSFALWKSGTSLEILAWVLVLFALAGIAGSRA